MTEHDGQLGSALVCDLSAIPSTRRASHVALARWLFGGEHPVTQSPDGLEVSLPSDRLGDIVSFIENERRCCRHLAFSVDIPASHAPLTLRVIGPGANDELQSLIR